MKTLEAEQQMLRNEAWCYSESHAMTLSNQIYTQGSCAVFWHDADGTGQNLYPYYVLVVNK